MTRSGGAADRGPSSLRGRAEQRLAGRAPREERAAAPSAEALARLVHELQVHQIELEVQNEELVATRASLEEALARYVDLYDFAPVGYFKLTRGGEILSANLEGARLLGLDRAQLVGKTLASLLSVETRALLAPLLAETGEAAARCVVEPRGAPGRRLRLVGDRRGLEATVRVVADDVSALERAEHERGRLAVAIEQIDESVVITDGEGRITFVNPAFERLTGYTSAEAVGKTPALLRSGAHDEIFYAQLWSALRAGHVWRGRFVNRRKDGSLYTEETVISPLRAGAERITGYVAVRHDVTGAIAIERELQHARRMEAVGRLAGGVAHDFNNLLMVIKASTEFALATMADDAPARAEVQEIERAADRAASLTRQLLAYGRKQLLRPARVDLGALAASTASMLQRVIGEDVRLRFEPSPALWPVLADPGQIEQVLMNLSVNARDAMPEGGELVFRTTNVPSDAPRRGGALESAPPGDYVALTVSDTGVGIAADVLGHVFEPFFTTKPLGRGTGLGLATVYGIVKQSGGFVGCASEPGKGASFTLYFPRHRATAPTTTRAARARRATRAFRRARRRPAARSSWWRTTRASGRS